MSLWEVVIDQPPLLSLNQRRFFNRFLLCLISQISFELGTVRKIQSSAVSGEMKDIVQGLGYKGECRSQI